MENHISSDLIRGHIDTIILCTLTENDKFPNEICQEIEEKSNKNYVLNQATLYSSLKRLESLKYVSSYWHDADVGGRRKFYHLTDLGKEAIEKNSASWQYSRSIIDKLVADSSLYSTLNESNQPLNDAKNDALTQNNPSFNEETAVLNQKNEDLLIKNSQLLQENQNLLNQLEALKNSSINNCEEESFSEECSNDTSNLVQPTQLSFDFDSISVNNFDDSKPDISSVNFRAVLNKLIDSSNVVKEEPELFKQPEEEPLTQIKNINTFEPTKEVMHSVTSTTVGQIDFTDLIEKMAENNITLKISKPLNSRHKNVHYVNKINFTAILASFMLFLVELLVVSLFFNSSLKLNTWHYIVAIVLAGAIPVFTFLHYKNNFDYITTRLSPTINAVLTPAIVLFNIALIDIAAVILLNIDLSSTLNIFLSIVFPLFIIVDIFMFFVFKYVIIKKGLFSLN